MPRPENLRAELARLADPKKAVILQKFFKTGKGEYGAGDRFLGITVPKQRQLVKKYWQTTSPKELDSLLRSPFHEHRLTALLIAVRRFEKGSAKTRQALYRWYLSRTRYINNWDLVDLSAPNIIGEFLQGRDCDPLYRLAGSKQLWERRIAVLATFAFIKRGEAQPALALSERLLQDKHDLIHKATGWMLREAGKRCGKKFLTDFLDQHAAKMPRTMLRYSIERLPLQLRKIYLNK